jgi:tRNA pseudouridine32 synthase / 23S rRNA pseudouridine746 synthase
VTDAAAGFETIYADSHLLVLNKPAGLLSVPGKGADKQDCLSARVQQHYPDALIVHRLDMATSGLMLMARGPAIQTALSKLFEQRQIHKRYVAVVDGHMNINEDWQLIDLPIALDWPNRPLRIISATGKPSQTRWRALQYDADTNTTRVELEPITGRSHQLRVHLKALGHPILGDALYAPAEAQAKATRLQLHACTLRFLHPATGEAMVFDSAPSF